MSYDDTPYKDDTLYFVKSGAGAINVAKYLQKHNLFFATGDSIGYFPEDLIIGKSVDLSAAFPVDRTDASIEKRSDRREP